MMSSLQWGAERALPGRSTQWTWTGTPQQVHMPGLQHAGYERTCQQHEARKCTCSHALPRALAPHDTPPRTHTTTCVHPRETQRGKEPNLSITKHAAVHVLTCAHTRLCAWRHSTTRKQLAYNRPRWPPHANSDEWSHSQTRSSRACTSVHVPHDTARKTETSLIATHGHPSCPGRTADKYTTTDYAAGARAHTRSRA